MGHGVQRRRRSHASPRLRVLRRLQLWQFRSALPGPARDDHGSAHRRSLHGSRRQGLGTDGIPVPEGQGAHPTVGRGRSRRRGAEQGPRAVPAGRTDTIAQPDGLLHVLLTLAAVLVTGRALGVLLARVGQPPVIGEVLAGIVLGPSLLGRFAPGLAAAILPPSVAPQLRVIAGLSVILYMFIVGLDLRGDLLRGRARGVVLTSNASIVVPFLLGTGLAAYLYPRLSPPDVPFTSFALF